MCPALPAGTGEAWLSFGKSAGRGENLLEFGSDLEPHESPDGVLPSGNWRSVCALRNSPEGSLGSQGWSMPAAELAFPCCWEQWCHQGRCPRSLGGQWGVQRGSVPWHHRSTRAPALSLQQNLVGTREMGTAECNLCFKEVLSFSFIPSWPLILKLAGECDFPAWPIALRGSELFSVALGILHPVPT